MKKTILGLILAAGTMLSTAACAGGYHSGYANVPPPPLRSEYYGAARPGYVWVGGYWNWSSGRYVWRPGHWARPPRARAVWVAPAWEHRNGRYQFRRGYWR
jgi:hypothetical protein